MRRLTSAAVVLGLAVAVLAGCGHGSSPSGDTQPSASGSTSPSPSPSSSPSPSEPTATEAADCGPSDLHVSVQPGDGTAGTLYAQLAFRNSSTKTCLLEGHPGVSFFSRQGGGRIGAPATRYGQLHRVVLSPGATTTAVLAIRDAGNYDAAACGPEDAAGLQVFPPGSRVSVFVPYRVQACRHLKPPPESLLRVSAVGEPAP